MVTITLTVASSALTAGVLTSVPQWATWTGEVWTSQTWRKMPLPGYQREDFGGLSRRTARAFSLPSVFRKGVRSSRKEA